MPPRYVLDSNIITALLKKESLTAKSVAQAEDAGATLLLCPVVRYEIRRGLLHKQAARQLAFFDHLATRLENEPFGQRDWDLAAMWWAMLRQQGHPLEDADILIGAYAYTRRAIMVTDNVRHFEPLTELGLTTDNWRRP